MNIDSILHEWVEQERIEQIGAERERAAIVAWLRTAEHDGVPQVFARAWAASIERGEHWKPEGGT
jgi:hypothetical protein